MELFVTWFDKFIWNEFERTKYDPEGVGQEARNKKSPGAILNISVFC
jgi:hypothetical protein